MDPLSISSATLSLIDATVRLSGRLISVLKVWKNAPAAIFALNNELSDLAIVLDRAKEANETIRAAQKQSGGPATTAPIPSSLESEFKKAEGILAELDVFVSQLSNMNNRKKRLRWVKSGNSLATTKKDELREIRMRINEIFAAHNASTGGRIEIELRSLRDELNHQAALADIRLDAIQTSLRYSNQRLEHIATDTRDHLTISSELAQLVIQQHRSTTGLSTSLRWHSTSQIENEHEYSSQPPNPMTTDNTNQAKTLKASSFYKLTGFGPEDVSMSTSTTTAPALSILPASYRGSTCNPSCTCQCHDTLGASLPTYAHFKLPRLLTGLLGSLFIGYIGMPVTTTRTKCDLVSCSENRTSANYLMVNYVFPSWLVNYALQAVIYGLCTTQLPTITLVFRPRVKFELGGIMHRAETNDVEGLKIILSKNPYAIHYTDHMYGITPLFKALSYAKMEAVEFLLKAGASLDVAGDDGITPGMFLAASGLAEMYPPLRDYLQSNLTMSEYTAKVMFHPIARYVALRGGYMEILSNLVCQRRQPGVDEVDALGQTALHWAVRSGSPAAIRRIIPYSLEESRVLDAVAGHDGNQPSDRSIARLVVSDETQQKYKVYPIHIANEEDDKRFGDVVLVGRVGAVLRQSRGGSCQADSTCTGSTGFAIFFDRMRCIKALLRDGADINHQEDVQGSSVVHVAVSYNVHETLEVLLRAGPDPSRFCKPQKHTILHCAAAVGDLETMRLLLRHPLPGIDVDERNVDGFTARELFGQRWDATGEIRTVFEQLVEVIMEKRFGGYVFGPRMNTRVDSNSNSHAQDETDNEGDEFHDAVTGE